MPQSGEAPLELRFASGVQVCLGLNLFQYVHSLVRWYGEGKPKLPNSGRKSNANFGNPKPKRTQKTSPHMSIFNVFGIPALPQDEVSKQPGANTEHCVQQLVNISPAMGNTIDDIVRIYKQGRPHMETIPDKGLWESEFGVWGNKLNK
eukprot:3489499-Amphidinium_carterae.1